MIQITSQNRIFISEEPLDFRNGFNGTAAACRTQLKQNPLDGGLFVFINRSQTMIRLYLFDGHGEWSITKRIARGHFSWWRKGQLSHNIVAEHLYLLLRGGRPADVRLPEPWKKMAE